MRGATAANAAGSLWWMRSCTVNIECSASSIGGHSLATTRMSGRSPGEEGDVMDAVSGSGQGQESIAAQALGNGIGGNVAELEAGSRVPHRRVDMRMVQHAAVEHERIAGVEAGLEEGVGGGAVADR